jgi:hypothetical protein
MSTGTPCVRTSNTAERRLDCSTSARSCSGGASPSTEKVTADVRRDVVVVNHQPGEDERSDGQGTDARQGRAGSPAR